jgi:hypothetical protein
MVCSAKPDYEVLWAEGMAHAWFCEKHLKEWLKESVEDCAEEGFSNKNCGVDSVKKLQIIRMAMFWIHSSLRSRCLK